MRIGNVDVSVTDNFVRWTSGMKIDADGSPHAYAPIGSGLPALDYLPNAGHEGNWYGLVTDSGLSDGQPIIQGPNDPAPGYYVSQTALLDHTRPLYDPRCYVDSETVPYISIPPELIHQGVHTGDVCMVTYKDLQSAAVVGDVGPRNAIGEGSIALARVLGMRSNAKKDVNGQYGGVDSGVSFTIYKHSRTRWPRDWVDIDAQARQLLGILGQ